MEHFLLARCVPMSEGYFGNISRSDEERLMPPSLHVLEGEPATTIIVIWSSQEKQEEVSFVKINLPYGSSLPLG